MSRNPSGSKPTARRSAKDPVFCVGWRAYVNWPLATDTISQPVPAMSRDGYSLDSDLADGQEVEILSWQPRSRVGLLYEIRRVTDGSEWWLAAAHLRRTSRERPVAALGSEVTSR